MEWARRIVPPGWLLLTLLSQWALHHFLPIARVVPPAVGRLGIVLLAGAVVLAGSGVTAFRRVRTPVIPFERSTTLVTTGVYRFTRNPMYLGLMLVAVGTALLLGSIGAFVPLPPFVWIIRYGYVRAEERFLEQIFGRDYAQYKSAVRRWL